MILDELVTSIVSDFNLPEDYTNMINYAYTDYKGQNRDADWFIRTQAAYLTTGRLKMFVVKFFGHFKPLNRLEVYWSLTA